MNVFEKLQQMRYEVQQSNIKKTGNNKHLGYNYYELSDFLPTVNKLMNEHKLCSCISFGKLDDVATLEIINSQEPSERITFVCPMSTAELKNCHPVQNLGASTTYIRRYLWVTALELTDGDAIEPTTGQDAPKPTQQATTPKPQESATQSNSEPIKTLSSNQMGRLYAIAKAKGRTGEQVNETIKKKYHVEHANQMTNTQYREAVAAYEALPDVE